MPCFDMEQQIYYFYISATSTEIIFKQEVIKQRYSVVKWCKRNYISHAVNSDKLHFTHISLKFYWLDTMPSAVEHENTKSKLVFKSSHKMKN